MKMVVGIRQGALSGLLAAVLIASPGMILASTTDSQKPSDSPDDTDLRTVIQNLNDSWNRSDADGWVKDYAEDCILINMLGTVLAGRQANKERHATVFAGIFKNSTLTSEIRQIKHLGRDAAFIDVDLTLKGYQSLPPGVKAQADGSLRLLMRHILQKQNGKWAIVASQITPILTSVPP